MILVNKSAFCTERVFALYNQVYVVNWVLYYPCFLRLHFYSVMRYPEECILSSTTAQIV